MRTATLVIALFGASAAQGACVSEDPVVVAKWLYENAPGFAFRPKDAGNHLAPALHKLIERDQLLCPKGDVCALDWDPWTDAQDGQIFGTPTFSLIKRSTTSATVRMDYIWANSDDPKDGKPHTNKLFLTKGARNGCWGLLDLESRSGPSRSLKRTFEQWSDKDYGT